ncbi:MAG: SGNH/GDSL hydrolase family protein [Gammaproteobacteria bacterium]
MVLLSNLRRMCATGLVIIGLGLSASVHATSYNSMVVFGDSLSDSGNIFDLFGGLFGPEPPYADSRFTSNFTDGTAGLVWVEHMAALMGLPLDNSVAGGTNYAFGGARATENPGDLVPSMPDQLNFYFNDTNNVADPNALYVVFGGGNDVRDNDAANAAASMAQMITDLAAAGATNFFVPSLPDIGLTPEALSGGAPGGTAEEISAASAQHNANLAAEIANLEATLGINIISFDLGGIFTDVIADPGAFGITNTNEACILTECLDPDSYLFFDGIHPTAAVHQVMGQLAFESLTQVPVPAALPLFLAALGVFGVRRRKVA